MQLENIVEICVALDIAIIGIAYPIIIDKISNIGDKYSSEYISVLFDNEIPQKKINISLLGRGNVGSLFALFLYATLISVLFLIIKIPPPFGLDFWIINNSANIITLLLTVSLTILFFTWINKVALYNGKSKRLLKYLILRHNAVNEESELKSYHLKAINEITVYAIEKQDEHLQETLLQFYYSLFSQVRKNHNKSEPLVYPVDIYHFIYKLNYALSDGSNKKLLTIEHRAVSGLWLLGDDYEDIQISEETYRWLWSNIYSICDNERFVKMFWANSANYFDYRLRIILPEIDTTNGLTTNENAINKRNEERKRFREFHYAFGGLLLFKRQYGAIRYLHQYSQSDPPHFVLLPESMSEIFEWFEFFRNDFKNIDTPIDIKYPFPGIDNLGIQRQIIYWICCHLALLFIRQYSLTRYYIYQDFVMQPQLPDDIIELKNWVDSVSYFEYCLKDILANHKALYEIGYEEIAHTNEDNFFAFLRTLRDNIKEKIGEQKVQASLSSEKIRSFNESTNRIITEAFGRYKGIFQAKFTDETENDIRLPITGGKTLLSKSAFTDHDIPVLHYDSVFAEQIAHHNIQRLIPKSFTLSRTKRYLLSTENLLLGIERLTNNRKDAVIVAVNVGLDIQDLLQKSKFLTNIVMIHSSEPLTSDVLFVLMKKNLPVIDRIDLTESEKDRLQVSEPINEELKLYTSVLDLSDKKNKLIKDEWGLEVVKYDDEPKVQVAIAFTSIIHWRQKRELIQIDIASRYKEQGFQTDINEIDPLD